MLLVGSEFTLAEIEHFVDGNNKDHPKVSAVPAMPRANCFE